jgi:hypothetical protein
MPASTLSLNLIMATLENGPALSRPKKGEKLIWRPAARSSRSNKNKIRTN